MRGSKIYQQKRRTRQASHIDFCYYYLSARCPLLGVGRCGIGVCCTYGYGFPSSRPLALFGFFRRLVVEAYTST